MNRDAEGDEISEKGISKWKGVGIKGWGTIKKEEGNERNEQSKEILGMQKRMK